MIIQLSGDVTTQFHKRADLPQPSDQPPRPDLTEGDVAPVTAWLRQLEGGNAQVAQPIYEHFCVRLQELARGHVPANIRGVYDQDDVTVSAFHSLFLGVREQRYQLRDRRDFWRLLITIAERKIMRRVRHETREKRDVRRDIRNSVFLPRQGDASSGVESMMGQEPTPAFAVEVSDTCETLLASLPDDTSRKIAVMKLESYTADEIAAKLKCTRRTVQRKLLVIRRTWKHVGEMEQKE